MADIQALHHQWRNLAADKARAQRKIRQRVEENLAEAQRLKDEALDLERTFESDWAEKKKKLKHDHDEAVKAELRKGRSAQSILRELGSKNTVWIYGLAKEIKSEGSAGPKLVGPEQSQPETVDSVNETAEGVHPEVEVDGPEWLHNDHKGVHGWLISADRYYIKKYGQPGSPFEGEFFICDAEYNFQTGSKELFDSVPNSEIQKRVDMLTKLLDGEYKGKIVLAPNPWRS